ncbi:WYL domain-containing protein [uncultured Anaerotruncus sp.]|uniref:helix-turn-helix transcriptional regulator n=1 Tax=uncultured Anaerotruncus sp. TaxID=905011 RepID=UPI00280B5D3D|nr:WYL domain-containing protein [uncultured Anaerotruncus sp.]
MPKNPNQKLKLLYLMRILLERTDDEHGLTLPEILDELDGYGVTAERKSIYDDLEALRVYGLDVERAGHKYFIANRTFQLPELKLLVDAVQSSKFITHKKSTELIKKVESLASVHEARLLQRQVFVTNRIKTMNESIYYNVDKIHAAITAGVKISYRYFEWAVDFSEEGGPLKKQFRRDGKRYRISPWALTWDDENYYMIGFDGEAGIIKHYRVDKMAEIQLTAERRDGQAHFDRFDMALYSKRVFGMFAGEEETVRLRFANHLAGVVLDRFGKDVFLSRADDAHFNATVRVQVSPQFYSWVFGFGGEVKILAPGHVAQGLCAAAREVLALYSE